MLGSDACKATRGTSMALGKGEGMARWTKESALAELSILIRQAQTLAGSQRMSADHTLWLAKTLQLLESVFGPSSLYYLSFKQLRWQQTGSFVVQAWDIQGALDARHHRAFLRDLETARGLLQAAYEELERDSIDGVYKGEDSPAETSGILKVLSIAEHKLRKVIRKPPAREREIQDAFEGLLIGADLDFSRETESIEYSSKTYVPDFTISRLDLAVEIKLSARQEREKEIIPEINDDILAYKQKYRNMLFVVYDLGFIRDVEKFGNHFEENEGVVVRIVKH
jgi:hypothetical protein